MNDDPLLTVEGFVARFGEVIQPRLNWGRFQDERWPIEHREVKDAKQLALVEVPICVDAQGLPCGLEEAVKRVTVGEVPGLFDHLGPSPERMRNYDGGYRDAGIAAAQLPAYGLSDSRALLLDGLHHSVGALLAAVSVAIDLYTIRGPIESKCLPDLAIS